MDFKFWFVILVMASYPDLLVCFKLTAPLLKVGEDKDYKGLTVLMHLVGILFFYKDNDKWDGCRIMICA